MDTSLVWPKPFADSVTGQLMLSDKLCEIVYPSGFVVKTLLASGRAVKHAGQVAVPTLTLWGGMDEVVSIEKAMLICEKTGGENRVYAEADHSLNGAFYPMRAVNLEPFQDIADWVAVKAEAVIPAWCKEPKDFE